MARLAQRIGIIHQGRLLQELDIEALERNRRRQLTVRTRDGAAALRVLLAAGQPAELGADGLLTLNDAASVERPDEVNRRLVEAGTPPTQLLVEEEELEPYFLRLVGGNGGGANV